MTFMRFMDSPVSSETQVEVEALMSCANNGAAPKR